MTTNEHPELARREVRLACAPTEVRAHVDGRDKPIAGQIVEVSKAGIQLHVNEPLPVGALVAVEMGRTIVWGDVRHCDLRPDRHYTVGVRTCDVKNQSTF